MARDLNKSSISVSFLPEMDDVSCADTIVKIGKKEWRLADFKYSTSTNYNTIAEDIIKGVKQADSIALKMIYAKEPPEIAQALLGKPLWNKIYRETGVEGGLGHKIYEELRTLPRTSQKYRELKQKSIEYYAHFQD